jgi:tight adherence protein C
MGNSPSALTVVLGVAALLVFAGGIFTAVFVLARNPATHTPRLGNRGLKRQKALEEGGLFKSIEPLMRLVAGWVAHLPIPQRRRAIDELLVHSGDWLGLTADEYIALSLICGVGATLVGLSAATILEFPVIFAFFFSGLGAILPYMKVTGEMGRRFKEVNRSLPTSIDLAALCMGAGLDFPGALRQITEKAANREDALVEEFSRILQELDLGRTRRQALEGFAERVPTDAVRDFVGAVVQAEEKGNPLAEVLRIQAHMLRMRRSIMAEENAARAAVLMMAPLMLIFAAIIVILLGPFIVTSMSKGI